MEVNKNLEIKKQRAFEYMVIKHPTIAEAEEGKGSEIIVPLKQICANDEAGALLLANRSIPEDQMPNVARLEVVLRGF